MKKIYFILFLFSITYISTAQENKLLKEIDTIASTSGRMNFILQFPFSDLENNDTIEVLRKKSNLDLNSLLPCMLLYMGSTNMKLSFKEKEELKKRVIEIAEHYYNTKRYVILEDTSGIAPISGLKIDIIAKKNVVILLSGGGCVVTDETKLMDEITAIFNTKMKALLNKK